MHTPGPWAASGITVFDANNAGCTICRCNDDSECTNGTDRKVMDREQALANATLIAAAPDFLAACQAFLRYGFKGQLPDGRWVRDVIEEAVTKAVSRDEAPCAPSARSDQGAHRST